MEKLAENGEQDQESSSSVLWEVSTKLMAIAELLKNQTEAAVLSEQGTYGLGAILGNLASELSEVEGDWIPATENGR